MDPKRLEKLSPFLTDDLLAERFLAEAHDAAACVAYLARAMARKAELEAQVNRTGAAFERSINWREADGQANGATFVLERMIKGWLADHGWEGWLADHGWDQHPYVIAAVLREAVRLVRDANSSEQGKSSGGES